MTQQSEEWTPGPTRDQLKEIGKERHMSKSLSGCYRNIRAPPHPEEMVESPSSIWVSGLIYLFAFMMLAIGVPYMLLIKLANTLRKGNKF